MALFITKAPDILRLDGGGYTAMYINRQGIVNYPTGNKTFDNKGGGERKVANILSV